MYTLPIELFSMRYQDATAMLSMCHRYAIAHPALTSERLLISINAHALSRCDHYAINVLSLCYYAFGPNDQKTINLLSIRYQYATTMASFIVY